MLLAPVPCSLGRAGTVATRNSILNWEADVLPRLGRVLYWAGCFFAGFIVVLLFSGALGQGTEQGFFYSVLAVLVWMLGWAARNVLAGK